MRPVGVSSRWDPGPAARRTRKEARPCPRSATPSRSGPPSAAPSPTAGRRSCCGRGGIAEPGGQFRVEHPRFWLYPTYAHQQAAALKPDGQAFLAQSEADRPSPGVVRLTHWAEVGGVFQLHNLVAALKLGELHFWTPETVQSRFAYRAPGLVALPLRVWKAPGAVELPETPYYAGCKSWVELERELPTEGSTPVLDGVAFRGLMATLERLLEPTAMA